MAGHGHFIHKIDRFEPNVQTPTNNHPLAMDRDVNRAGYFPFPTPVPQSVPCHGGLFFPSPSPHIPSNPSTTQYWWDVESGEGDDVRGRALRAVKSSKIVYSDLSF